MELTYEKVTAWFDKYFEDVNKNQGPLETVPNLKKYFTSDFEFVMYTIPPVPQASMVTRPMSREGLLMLFLHPGLHEGLVPQYYVVDLKKMIVVVQFEIRFSDRVSGKTWPPMQASAHYHLVLDENKDLKIRKIQYWIELIASDETMSVFDVWIERRDEALMKHAVSYINAKP